MPSLAQAIAPSFNIRIYGKLIDSITMGAGPAAGANLPAFSAGFAYIEGFRIGSECVRLPIPVIMTVDGTGTALGTAADPAECGFGLGYSVWQVLADKTTLALTPESGPMLSLLESFAVRGVDGGLELLNPRIEGTKICIDIHAWAEIKYLGQKVDFNETITKCINVGEPCYTAWEIGWARIELCYRHPYQAVVKLTVGKWGIEKSWERVIDIPHFQNQPTSSCGCPQS